MEWRDEGIILGTRKHGETSAIIEVMTAAHGRHMGMVRGGRSSRQRPVLQPGNSVLLEWRARLEEHLGTFTVEGQSLRAAQLMELPLGIYGLQTLAAHLRLLPERDPHPELYARSRELLAGLGTAPDWPARYAAWELALLAELGFGLDLATCAALGTTEDLVWVSPKSGRAVSRQAGAPWADRLLPLPAFLRDGWPTGATLPATELADALRLTGHFLENRLAPQLMRESLPAARARAVDAILRAAALEQQ